MKENGESGWLFGKPEPKPGEVGYLDPRFHRNEKNEIVDRAGNIYDESYTLIREAPTEGLQQAQRTHKNFPKEAQSVLGHIYQQQMEKQKKQKSN